MCTTRQERQICTKLASRHTQPFKVQTTASLQDPSIKQMAEQIAQDPSFAQMAQAMQGNMAAMMGGAAPPAVPASTRGAAAEEPTTPGMPAGMPGMPGGMDPSAYANMMSDVLQNPQFVEMAEKLGQQIMQVVSPAVTVSCVHAQLPGTSLLVCTALCMLQY